MWTFNLLMLFVMAGHSQLEVNISSFFTSSSKTARTFSLIILDDKKLQTFVPVSCTWYININRDRTGATSHWRRVNGVK